MKNINTNSLFVFDEDKTKNFVITMCFFFGYRADAQESITHIINYNSSNKSSKHYTVMVSASPAKRIFEYILFREGVIHANGFGTYILFALCKSISNVTFNLRDNVRFLENHPVVIAFPYLLLIKIIIKYYSTTTNQTAPAWRSFTSSLFYVHWSQVMQYAYSPSDVSSLFFGVVDTLLPFNQNILDAPNSLESSRGSCSHASSTVSQLRAFNVNAAAFCISSFVVQRFLETYHFNQSSCYATFLSARFAKDEQPLLHYLSNFTPESCPQKHPFILCKSDDGPTSAATKNPFISICILSYEQEDLAGEAIASALAQNYTHFEIIVIGDNFTDLIAAMSPWGNDARIRYIELNSKGRFAARNRCVQEANGEYILWLESDNLLQPDVLRDYACIIKQHDDVNIVYGDIEFVDEDLESLYLEAYRDWHRDSGALLAGMAIKNVLPNVGMLVKVDCFETLGLFSEDFQQAQNYEWLTRVPGKFEVKHAERIVCKCKSYIDNLSTREEDFKHLCNILDSMLSSHSLMALCPDLDWAQLPINVCEALASLKFADRFAHFGCSGRALFWIRKALQAKAGPKINQLAAEYIKAISQKTEQDGLGNHQQAAEYIKAISQNAEQDGLDNRSRESGGNCRVLLVGEFFWPSLGGIEVFLEELGTGLMGQGIAVDVATKTVPARKSTFHRGMRIFEFPNYTNPDVAKPGGVADIGILVQKGGYDAVISLAHPSILSFYLLSLPQPRPQLIYLPIINRENLNGYIDSGSLPTVMRYIAQADTLVTITESSCDAQIIQTAGLPYKYIPHAVVDSPAPTSFRETIGFSQDIPLFVMVANYWPVKNHIGLIRVMQQLEGEWKLHIIGNPHLEWYFKQVQQAADGDKRIDVNGFTPRDITSAAIRDADILLLASNGEGCPMVILQAMAQATPWLATPHCGSVRDQAGGVVVALEHFPQVAKTLIQNPLLRKTLGDLGRQHAKKCFDIGKVSAAFADIILQKEMRYDFRYPENLRSKNDAVVQKVLELAGVTCKR